MDEEELMSPLGMSPETTGDFYLDNLYEEEAEQESSPISYYPQEEEEEVLEVDDEEAEEDYLSNFISTFLDFETNEEIEQRYGKRGRAFLGRSTFDSVHEEIVAKESRGNYRAFNPDGGGSGAVGKYQFRWNIWKPDIERVTGISSPEEFLNSPEAQDAFYKEWYVPNKVLPWVSQIKRHLKTPVSEDELIKLYHFRGPKGATDYLMGLVGDRPEEYNSPISSYTGIRPGRYMKVGGWVRKFYNTGGSGPLDWGSAWKKNNSASHYSPDTGANIHYSNPNMISTSTDLLADTRLNVEQPQFSNSFIQKGEEAGNSQEINPAAIEQTARNVATVGQNIIGAKAAIDDVKGKVMSNALSGASALLAQRRQKELETQELLEAYANMQNTFNSSPTDTLGKPQSML